MSSSKVYKRTRGAVPLTIGLVILVTVGVVAIHLSAMLYKATSISPSPGSDDGLFSFATTETEESFTSDGFPVVDWEYWQSVNSDVIAWVTVPGTDIDYPIVQAHVSAPDYYNTHDVYGNYSIFGCPFLHADNEGDGILNSRNAVMQAHNINGLWSGMFSAFAAFTDRSYAQAHATVLLQTPTHKVTLTVFATEVIPYAGSDTSLVTTFAGDEAFAQYVTERVSNSSVVFDEQIPSDKMWTFSTCSYLLTPSNERTVVHCSLVSDFKID